MVRIDHEYNIQPEGSVRGMCLLAWHFKIQHKEEPKRIKQLKGLVPHSRLQRIKCYLL